MRSLLHLLLLISLAALPSFAQTPQRHFERGEELVYEAEFSRALLRSMDVADFHFTTMRVPTATEKVTETKATYSLELKGEVKSKGFFIKLFKLDFLQRITSTIEPNSFSVRKTKRFDQQGKRIRESETIYDRSGRKVVWTETDLRDPSKQPRVASSTFSGDVQDVLSAIYFLRTQQLEIGKTLKLEVTDSGQVYEVPVRVAERKKIKTVLGKVDTFMLDVELFGAQRLIQSKGKFAIWVTADQRHIPVKARLNHEYGTFNIKLKKLIENSSLARRQ